MLILKLFAHLVITAAMLLLVSSFVKGVEVKDWGAAFIGAIVLGIVNAVVRPIMVFLTLPLTLLTFGLFLFVVNALMLWIVAGLTPGIQIERFSSAFLGSLLLTLLNIVIWKLTD